MSYSFEVATEDAPHFKDLRASVEPLEIGCAETDWDELEGSWPSGAVLHVYQRRHSTRAVELTFDGEAFCARVMSCASAEDYSLALDLCEGVAKKALVQVVSEEGLAFWPGRRDEVFDRSWIDRHIETLVGSVVRMAKSRGEVVTMTGTVRDFHLGPWVLAEIRAPEGVPLTSALLGRMRRLMALAEDQTVFSTSVLEVALAGGKKVRAAVCLPEMQCLIPSVDFLVISSSAAATEDEGPKDTAFLPMAALPGLVGERAERLDEHQWLIAAISAEEWPDLIRRAKSVAAPLVLAKKLPRVRKLRKPRSGPRPWWKFW